MLTDGEREQIIRDAIKTITAKGIKLGIQSWGIEWKPTKGKEHWESKKDQTCCALACVLLANQKELPKNVSNWRSFSIEKLLDTNTSWIMSFQKGFDGYSKSEFDQEEFAYELGVMIREELVK
jgi:hypothetical protein